MRPAYLCCLWSSEAPILRFMDVGMIVVGDEVLSGQVRDANGVICAELVRDRGHRLRRILIVPDEIPAIAGAVKDCLALGCDLIVTSGGVGPTHDDMTLEGVAVGLDVGLEECAEMRERVDGWIDRAGSAGVDPDALGARWLRRMAQVPKGGGLLEGSTGPAFKVVTGEVVVAILPGPPSQFEDGLRQVISEHLPPEPLTFEEIEHPYPESMFADKLAELAAEHPEVLIGSYPVERKVLLRLRGPEEAVKQVSRAIKEQLVRLELDPSGRAMRAAMRGRT
jgi:molybdenum cofactor synthesis domain-containing protein